MYVCVCLYHHLPCTLLATSYVGKGIKRVGAGFVFVIFPVLLK
jgi:hypothetical protein